MPGPASLRAEIESIRKDLESILRDRGAERETAAEAPPHNEAGRSELERQMGELADLARGLLEEAEETMSRHPVATVAGALALGIVIGRLTAR